MQFVDEVRAFLRAAQEHGVRLLLVDGGAVNFHGYQRHSADIDLWIDTAPENFSRLIAALRSLGYELNEFPPTVLRSEQNVSIKISPDMEIELITRFNPGCTFDEAWARGDVAELAGTPVAHYRVLNYDDLITSKLRSARPKDLLDVQELQRKRGRSEREKGKG